MNTKLYQISIQTVLDNITHPSNVLFIALRTFSYVFKTFIAKHRYNASFFRSLEDHNSTL